MAKVTLGLDFGTESVRALFVDLHGQEIAVAVVKYPHGQLTELLPDGRTKLPPLYALQHPSDWLRSAPAQCARPSARVALQLRTCWASASISPVVRCCPVAR